jgi:GAF domain-containing protein
LRSNSEIVAALDQISADLLKETRASRVTVRVDMPSRDFRPEFVLAEALSPGEKSLRGIRRINQHQSQPVHWMRRNKRPLIQNDVTTDGPPVPEVLSSNYGTKAQMLGPLLNKEELIGWISVHFNDGPRDWSAGDVGALERAVSKAQICLRDHSQ